MKSLKSTFDAFEEVSRENYYLRKITSNERREVERIVETVSLWASNRCLEDTHVLAVGSSTLPDWYWLEMERIRVAFPELVDVPEEYNDLNLRVLFTQRPSMRPQSLRNDLVLRLKEVGYSPTPIEGTKNKGRAIRVSDLFDPLEGRKRQCTIEPIQSKYTGIEVSVPGIKPFEIYLDFTSPCLKGGLSPGAHLQQEREYNRPFSLLYPR